MRADDQRPGDPDRTSRAALTQQLARVELELRRCERRLEVLGEQVAKEGADVRRLEGFGPTALLHALLGDRSELLARERAEWIAVQVRYDDHLRRLTELQREEATARAALARLGEQAADVSGEPDEPTTPLQTARTLRDRLAAAADVGREALATLGEAAEQMVRAVHLPMSATTGAPMRNPSVDAAHNLVARAQWHLDRLQDRIGELGVPSATLARAPGTLPAFADGVLASLLRGWAARRRVADSLDQVHLVRSDVQEIVLELERFAAAAAAEVARLGGAERSRDGD